MNGINGHTPNGIGSPGKSQMTTLKCMMKEVINIMDIDDAVSHTSV